MFVSTETVVAILVENKVTSFCDLTLTQGNVGKEQEGNQITHITVDTSYASKSQFNIIFI